MRAQMLPFLNMAQAAISLQSRSGNPDILRLYTLHKVTLTTYPSCGPIPCAGPAAANRLLGRGEKDVRGESGKLCSAIALFPPSSPAKRVRRR